MVGFAAAGWIDARRDPESRTHIGRFWLRLVDGDGLGETVSRKLAANADALTSSVFATALPIVFVVVAYWLFVGSGRRHLRGVLVDWAPAMWGALAFAILASLLNDSGVALLGASLLTAIPLVVSFAAASNAQSLDARGNQ